MDELVKTMGSLDLEALDAKGEKLKEVQKCLATRETCSRWMEEMRRIPLDELKLCLAVYKSEFEDFAQRMDENESDLKYEAVERISKRCIQILVYTMEKEFDEVPSLVAETYQLIKDCSDKKYFSEEYAPGFCFVVKGLDIYFAIQSKGKTLELEQLQEYLEDLNKYDKLCVKSQVGVFAIKQYIIGNIDRKSSHQKQIWILEQMIGMDPENLEWHFCLYTVEKYYRETLSDSNPPSEKEKKAILAAMDIPGANADPRILLGYIVCLAEIFRSMGKRFRSIQYGRKFLASNEEVLKYIHNEVQNIFSFDATSVKSNIGVSKIYSSILPPIFRDKEFAKFCIKRALLFHPNSSKANHRMGIFYLSIDCPTQALKYMKRAFEGDERNFFCMMDLIRIYMGDIATYKNELTDIYKKVLGLSYYQVFPQKLSTIIFTQSIWKFMEGQRKRLESIDLLVESYKVDVKAEELFKELERHMARYKWHQNLNAPNLIADLRNALSKEFEECSDAERKAILEKLLKAANLAANLRGTGYSGRRGGGGGSGSRGRGGQRSGYNSSYGSSSGQGRREEHFTECNYRAQDHWSILGVMKGASKAEIKAAYYKLAKEHHPDKHHHLPQAEILKKQEQMKFINTAYEILTCKFGN